MRIYPINQLPDTLVIGKQTEQGVNEIRFDCAPWLALWPDINISVWPTPPGGSAAYPAAAHMEGDLLVWVVSAADTSTAGRGYVEIVGTADGKKKLSATVVTRVLSTHTGTTAEPPEAAQPWVDVVLDAAKRAEDAAARAEEAGGDAGGESTSGGAGSVVQYDKEQSLTDAQKAQARENIGAISKGDFIHMSPRTPPPGIRYRSYTIVDDLTVFSVDLKDELWTQDDYKFAPAIKITSAGDEISDAAGGQASSVVVSLSPKLEDGSIAPNPSGGRFAPWTEAALNVNGVETTAIVAGSPYAGTVDFVTGKTEAAGVRIYQAADLFELNTTTAPGTSSQGVKYIRVQLKADVQSLDFANLLVACNRYEMAAYPYPDKSIRVGSNMPYIYDNDIDIDNPLAILDGLEFMLSDGNAETFSGTGQAIVLNQGNNAITSVSGDVMVTYGIDTKTYIDRKFAELSAAMLGG